MTNPPTKALEEALAEYAQLYHIALATTGNVTRAKRCVEAFFQGRLQQQRRMEEGR